MHKLIKFWNQKRKNIILAVGVIAFVIIIIQIFDGIAEEQNNNKKYEVSNPKLPTQSIIGKGSVSEEETIDNVDIIEKFIKYCNEGNVNEAYNMLTDKCKEVLYPTLEIFEKNYHQAIFKKDRIASIKNYIDYTYLVDLYEDVMASGNMENADCIQDYITVESDNEELKLNINKLVKVNKYNNKEVEKNNVKITVLRREIYINHEEYQINVENNTDKTIMIDSKQKDRATALVSANGIHYSSNVKSLFDAVCRIEAKENYTYKIKFNKIYNDTIKSDKIKFSDIVLNIEEYKQKPNTQKETIEIILDI